MKYYIDEKPKNDFYLLGNLTPTGFIEARGSKFIKEYLDEFPFLVNEVSVIDEQDNKMSFEHFYNKIKN